MARLSDIRSKFSAQSYRDLCLPNGGILNAYRGDLEVLQREMTELGEMLRTHERELEALSSAFILCTPDSRNPKGSEPLLKNRAAAQRRLADFETHARAIDDRAKTIQKAITNLTS